jgi:hypothetical protein
MVEPFDGNLLPGEATGGQIEFHPGWQHVSIHTDGANVSYNRSGDSISDVHAKLYDQTGEREHVLIDYPEWE